MKLKDFLSKTDVTMPAFAKATKLSVNQVANAYYRRPVSLSVALTIEKATYGQVKPEDLISDAARESLGMEIAKKK